MVYAADILQDRNYAGDRLSVRAVAQEVCNGLQNSGCPRATIQGLNDLHELSVDPQDWQHWVANNRRWYDVWKEPDLRSLSRDRDLFQRASSAWSQRSASEQ
jgi:hypothetical protein